MFKLCFLFEFFLACSYLMQIKTIYMYSYSSATQGTILNSNLNKST